EGGWVGVNCWCSCAIHWECDLHCPCDVYGANDKVDNTKMAADTGKPVRVLHIVGGLDRGGVETWLVNVLRHIDRKRYSMDFVVHTTKACAYDDEVRALGARIFPCPYTHRPLKYASELRRILEEHGPYDVVHSHVYHYSGWVLQQASASGVPTRIAHSYNSISMAKSDISFLRRGYMRAMNYLIDRYATHKLANSKLSAASLFGEEWPRDPRYRLLYCGIDLAPFEETVNQDVVRRQLGLPPDAFVIGHVGR